MTIAPTVAPPGSIPQEVRRLAGLAWPVTLGMAAATGMTTVDTLVVGQLGAAALGELALGGLWFSAVVVPTMFILSGLDPIVSQGWGAGDRTAVGAALGRGVVAALLLAGPAMGAMLLAHPALAFLGQPATLLDGAARYCRLVCWAIPPFLVFTALRQFLQGLGIMRPAMVVTLLANGLNLILDLIFVPGRLGAPALGVQGAALATIACQGAMAIGLAWLVRDELRGWWSGWRVALDARAVARQVAMGVPVGLQVASEVWAFLCTSLMMGWLGPTEVATNAVLVNVASLTFMAPFGVSAALSTRVGNLVGAGHAWGRVAGTGVAMGVSVMALFAVLFTVAPGAVAGLYTEDATVLALATALFPIVGAFQIFDGLQGTCFGALRGAGDLRVPALANLVGYWIIGLPLALWLAFRAGQGPQGIWTGMSIGLMAVSVLALGRLAWTARRGRPRLQLG